MAAPSGARARVLALAKLREQDAAWRLLRADNAPVVAGLLGSLLGGDERRLAASDLIERLDIELDELRAHGLVLPRSAQGYAAEWREAGFLVRRPAEEARGETYELSAGALVAIRTLDGFSEPRQTATESRLASIAAQVEQLAVETDPDATRRLEQLSAQRDRLDAQIERIGTGELDLLDEDRAIERARDILAQVAEVPSDFARVRAEFEQLNRMLRERIVESGESQRHVLDDVFRGVDLINESDEGRSFQAFSALVLDPARGAAFDDDIERVLDRGFASRLSATDRRNLRRFLATLKAHSSEIHGVVTGFARGLRRYVQSQDFQRDRVLRGLIRDALAAAVPASAEVPPYRETRATLALSTVHVSSVAAIRLHNPADFDASEPIETNESDTVDYEALKLLARETEIDFDELARNVNDVLLELPSCTISQVLDRFPATQGVASVVGLIALGAAQGVRSESSEPGRPHESGASETITWAGTDGDRRRARIPLYRFTGRVA